MILALQSRLADALRTAARDAFGVELGAVGFQYPPDAAMGDLASNAAMALARSQRKNPKEIAAALAERMAKVPGVTRAEVAGAGFLNLFLDRGAAVRTLADGLQDPMPQPPRVPGHAIVEHTSINPNKAAHVGHLRNAILGDTFVRILRARGHDVGVQNYIDDTGVQVADVVVGFLHIENKSQAEVAAIPGKFDHYCWDLYARVGDFYAAAPENKAKQAEVLHAIEAGGNEIASLAEHVASRIVACHLETMARLGIRYELLAHESDILRLHFWNRAFALLKDAEAIRLVTEGKQNGCWVLGMGKADDDAPGSGRRSPGDEAQRPEGRDSLPARAAVDEDKILVRSNGTVTYTGKDIAYQLWKLGRLDRDFRYRLYRAEPDGHRVWQTTSGETDPQAPRFGNARDVYNVIDVGQSYPQRVVKAGVAALGYEREAAGTHHLAYEKVVLSPETARALGYDVAEDGGVVKVSGRKGLGVKADDLVDALEKKALAEIATRDPERDKAQSERTAREIAVGALRYFMLRYGRTRILTFDLEEALAFTGETGPYIQNAIVRARNIFTKLEAEGHAVDVLLARARALDLGALLDGEEGAEIWALALLMARSEEVAEAAVAAEEPSIVARHAFTVAQAFHGYYQKPKYSLLHAESEDRRALRVLVVDAFVRQMSALAGLLGIPVPERM
ncbi:MAG: arginine--tRNA ligase [Vicinamibacteria bacterium]|nr:arginine--tRNA ligase [Vicinamibacteria bacterium]